MSAKVVHISTVHTPHDPRIYHKQCRTLAKAGFDVTMIVTGQEDKMFLPQDGVKVIYLPSPANRWERMTRISFLAVNKARALNADIYHFHDPELIPFARKLKTKKNIVIFDIHEDYVTAMAQKKYLPKFIAHVVALVYRAVTKLLTGKFELCLAEKYYKEEFPRGKCILNYSNVIPRQRVANSYKSKHYNNLIYTGNVTISRGALIHAKLPRLDSQVAVKYFGKCSKDVAQQIYEYANGCRNRISITGISYYVPPEYIEDAYYKENWLAGLALFPPDVHYEKKELTKFFDYMAAEIPILCSDFPLWKQLVEKYGCGIAVNPNDNSAIVNALEFLKNNPEAAKEMGRKGRKAVLDRLNWNVEGLRLVEWYREMLAKV